VSSTKRTDLAAEAERLVAQGKLDAAAAKYEMLLRQSPRDLNTLNKIGDIYSRIGKKKQAIDHFLKLCEFYEKDGFVPKAIAIYKKVIKLDPSDISAARRLADLLASKRLVLEAREQYQIVLRKYEASGDMDNLIACRKAMVALDPQDAEGLRSLAELLAAAKRGDEAADAWAEAGAELDRRGEHEQARSFYQKASTMKPGSANIAARLAASHVAAGDVETGVRLVKEALSKSGDDADLLALLADIHVQAGERKEAGKALHRAIELAPQRSELRVRLARLHVSQGEIAGAFTAVEPVLGRLGKEEVSTEVVVILEEIIGKDGKHRDALQALFSLKLRAGDDNLAANHGLKLLDLFVENGDLTQAQSLVDRLIIMRPADEKLKERRGQIRSAMETPFAAGAGGAQSIEEVTIDADGEGLGGLDPSVIAALGLPEPLELTREDRDFIAEHMTEADVFVKYGLPDRAVEQLRVVMEKYPTYVPSLTRLKEIHLEEGQREEARRMMSMLVKAHLVAGERVAAEEALAELRRYDPTSRELMDLETALNPPPAAEVKRAPAAPPARPAAAPTAARVDRGDEEGDEEFEIVFEEEAVEAAPAAAKAADAPKAAAAAPGEQAAPKQPPASAKPAPAQAKSAAPPAKSRAAKPAPAADADDSLLDLAAEVDAALGAVVGGETSSISGGVEEPESLEDMVAAFRSNVEQTVGEDDAETRYNLGIAFMEMGLMDEAIGEFQVASRDERFSGNCCSMLGLCFRRKGMAAQAVRWYRRGLENGTAMEEQQALGLRYDLAEVLIEVGEQKEALTLYTEVFGVDSRFRDVATKIKDLQKVVAG